MPSEVNMHSSGICLNDPFFIEGAYYVDDFGKEKRHIKLSMRLVVRQTPEDKVINNKNEQNNGYIKTH